MKAKIKNKFGINLVSLVCIIVVIAIISGTVVLSFDNIYVSTKKKEFANEIYTIQKMAEEYKFKNGKYPTVGEKDAEDFSEIDLYELGVNETNRGRKTNGDDDVYKINENGKVKYAKGVNIGGKEYYSFSGNGSNLVLE